jgi:hypothetical protein
MYNNKKFLEKMKNDASEKIIFKDSSKKISDLNRDKKNKNIRKTINIKVFGKGNNKKDKNFRRSHQKSISNKIINKNYFIIFGNKRKLSEDDMKNNENISSKYYSLIHIDANNASNKRSQNSNIIFDF